MIHYALRDDVAILTIDVPPHNFFSEGLLDELETALRRFSADPAASLALLTSVGPAFSLGANPSELGVLYNNDAPRQLIGVMAALEKPLVCYIGGPALGSALEVVLACPLRLAGHAASFSFPDVLEGLPPAAGATQHLPRLIGLDVALSMLTDGVAMNAQRALEAGLVDKILDDEGIASAIQAAKDWFSASPELSRPVSSLPWPSDDIRLAIGRHRLPGRERREGEAFEAILNAVQAGAESYTYGCQIELQGYLACESSTTRRATSLLKLYRDAAQNRALAPLSDVDADSAAGSAQVVWSAGAVPNGCHVPEAGAYVYLASVDNADDVSRIVGGSVGTDENRVFLVDLRHPAMCPDAIVHQTRALMRPNDYALCFGDTSQVEAKDDLHDPAGSDGRLGFAFVYGSTPQTILQPLHRDTMREGWLRAVCRAARACNFVVVHGAEDRSIGAEFERQWAGIQRHIHQSESSGVDFGFMASVTTATINHGERSTPVEPAFQSACLLSNVAAGLIDQRLALHPDDIDVLAVYGYGFPPQQRGPMQWALDNGLRRVVDVIEKSVIPGVTLSALLRRAATGS